MTKNELKSLMEHLGVAPSKKLGQNFLIDEQFLTLIVREAAPQTGQKILEVGPGFGALTRGLAASGCELTAIEFDRKLAAYLRSAIAPLGVKLIEADACRVDYQELYQGQDFRVISNLPYSAGTIVVTKLLELENPPTDFLLMLQKEVAMRFIAEPGTDDYSSLSVRILASYEGQIVRNVPPEVFFPVPGVDSALLALKRRDNILPQTVRQTLSKLTRTGFAHRRKKMFKQIAAVFDADSVRAAMAEADVDPDIRAERVTVEQFVKMAEFLQGK